MGDIILVFESWSWLGDSDTVRPAAALQTPNRCVVVGMLKSPFFPLHLSDVCREAAQIVRREMWRGYCHRPCRLVGDF